MTDLPISDNQLVTVMVARTTFAVLNVAGQYYRVDYVEKAEAYVKPGMRGAFHHSLEHPLLLGYNNPLVSVYINSKPQDPHKLNTEIRARIEARLQGWRSLSSVLNFNSFQQNLLDGSGMLLQGEPLSIAQTVIDTCDEQNVLTWSTPFFGGLQGEPPFHLIIIGKGYVIAKDFRFIKLNEATRTAPPPSQSA